MLRFMVVLSCFVFGGMPALSVLLCYENSQNIFQDHSISLTSDWWGIWKELLRRLLCAKKNRRQTCSWQQRRPVCSQPCPMTQPISHSCCSMSTSIQPDQVNQCMLLVCKSFRFHRFSIISSTPTSLTCWVTETGSPDQNRFSKLVSSTSASCCIVQIQASLLELLRSTYRLWSSCPSLASLSIWLSSAAPESERRCSVWLITNAQNPYSVLECSESPNGCRCDAWPFTCGLYEARTAEMWGSRTPTGHSQQM